MWTCVTECFNELRYISDTQLRLSAVEVVTHFWPCVLALVCVDPVLG